MKGVTKVAAVFAMIALVAVGLAATVYSAGAADTPVNTAANTDTLSDGSETPTCGVSGTCKASCGCGCGGNPNNCGCGR